MNADAVARPAAYEPPALRVLGSVHGLTQYCDKTKGQADGFTYEGASVVCRSA
ncbi:MAG TPA: hypothetical protein VKA57_14120 [Solirubrobacteraceae bacterium]|nr:hypothetical protein [Solirubrobacteraceae bacterium]